jgi:tetratricopeptide (TPR) repeat protein
MSADSLAGYSEDEQKKRRIAIDCYKKGNEALSKQNFDYAVEMFGKSVMLVPDNLLYRQVLRGAEYRKYRDNKTGASMAFLRLTGVRGKTKKAKLQKNWRELDRAAEEGLAINPWDATFNAEVGEAASHLGYQEVAVFAYEKAVEAEQNNREYLRNLALAYERRSRFVEARTMWERLLKLDPLNSEARGKITEMLTKDTIQQGGFEEAEKIQDVVMGYEESVKGNVADAGGLAAPGESPEADLRHAIRKDPSSPGNYLKLADLLRKEKRFEESIEIYEKALQVTGGDPNVRERMEDVQLDLGRRNRDLARQEAAKHPDDAALQQQAADISRELLLQEISILSTRVDRYPQDLRLKAELAQRYFQTGKYGQAIPLFQQAAKDARLEAVVLVNLGKCFLKEKKNALAEHQFKRAVSKLNANDHLKALLECHFYLGRLAEEAGRREDAIQHFNEVISLDYGYKDARERLEKLQGDQGQETGLVDDE